MSGVARTFFLHVPKCGGTSLLRYLVDEWGLGAARKVPDGDAFLSDYPECIGAPLLHGHQFFPFVSLLPADCRVITLLRDPVERVVSAYEYILRKPTHVLHDEFKRAGIESLEQFVRNAKFSYHSVNMMTRMLGAEYEIGELIENGECATIDDIRATVRRLNEQPADEDCFQRACRRLVGMAAFGVLENMEQSLALFASTLGYKTPNARYWENVTPGSAERRYSSLSLAVVRELNMFDVEFYAYARRLFMERTGMACAEVAQAEETAGHRP